MLRSIILVLVVVPYIVALGGTHAVMAPRCFNIPKITACIDGRFRQYWEQNGGVAVFGYPITPARKETRAEGTFLTQYFERNRFEYHPENARPFDVLLGRLGADVLKQQGRVWEKFPQGRKSSKCLWFEATKHSVCDQGTNNGFKTYWENHGLSIPGLKPYDRSLALFGYPLSEPMVENNTSGDPVLTQWFERARFEWHPNKPEEFKVMLGLLGSELNR